MAGRDIAAGILLSCVLYSILLQHVCNGDISCMDENGKPVDWYMVYKLPRMSESTDPILHAGLGYMYLDSTTQKWSPGVTPINGTTGAIYNTLQQIYDKQASKDVAYVLYNDETPEKNESAAHGHTKGDVCFDEKQGFWLVHSVPRFPEYSYKPYDYPDSGTYYGQTFLCMTMSYKYLDIIGQQLLYNHPQIYDYNLPESFSADAPHMKQAAVDDLHVKSPPWQHQAELHTVAGQSFTSFAKYNKYGADLYDAWVAPTLGSGLQVETWRNGGRVLPTNCSTAYRVYNIDGIDLQGLAFPETEDHSKWAITTDAQKPWVCIGDINRMPSQEQRGGGTVCIKMESVWNAFNATVSKVEPCP